VAGGAPAGRGGPAASGTIAAVSGTTMQVQNEQTGQVAVAWRASTTFTQQVRVAASSIKAGDCITAVARSGTATTATTFTATTVSVSPAVNGSCTSGFGGQAPAGGRPSGLPSGAARPTSLPSGFPSGANAPSGRAAGRGGIGVIATGAVVSVSGSGVVVAARNLASGSSSSATVNKAVTLASTTAITAERAATARAVKVGRCASAQGSADSSGTVTATRISITDPVSGQCRGFGGGFGAPAGGGTGG
jgi:hypothetical protein